MRMSDWSSDVCSSDLAERGRAGMRAGRMKRRDEDRVGFRAACLERFAGIMDGHHYQQAEPAGLWRATDVALAQVNAVGAPAPRCIGRSEERRVGKECVRTCRSRVSAEY